VEIVNQLGELFLAAVPTVIIVFLFYLFMRWSFFEPMERVLSERHKRAEGARSEAEASRVASHEKQRFYTEAVKKVRIEVFAEQEIQRRRTLEERQATINSARATAQAALQEAKKGIAADVNAARTELERSKDNLANDIAEAILAGHPSGPDSSRGKGAAR
jgi:F0F1-type ATP synthase membrane subunit b/b'